MSEDLVMDGTGSLYQVMWDKDQQPTWVHLGSTSLAGCQNHT